MLVYMCARLALESFEYTRMLHLLVPCLRRSDFWNKAGRSYLETPTYSSFWGSILEYVTRQQVITKRNYTGVSRYWFVAIITLMKLSIVFLMPVVSLSSRFHIVLKAGFRVAAAFQLHSFLELMPLLLEWTCRSSC